MSAEIGSPPKARTPMSCPSLISEIPGSTARPDINDLNFSYFELIEEKRQNIPGLLIDQMYL